MPISTNRIALTYAALSNAIRQPPLWIVTALAAVCMMILLLEYSYEQRSRHVAVAEAQKASFNLARSLAQHADDTMEMADGALLGISERLRIDGVSTSALVRLSQFLKDSVENNSRLRGLFVYDEFGNWIANSLPSTPPNMNNRDRDYFVYFLDSKNTGVYVGQPVRSRSGGEWIITVARKFVKPDGSFGGVILATIDVEYFSRFYSTFDVGRDGSLMLSSSAGRVLARYPQNERFVGHDFGGKDIFLVRMPLNWSATLQMKSPLDGIERIIGVQAGKRFPITLLSAVSEDEALADWRSSAVKRLVVTAFMLITIIFLGGFLLAYIRRHRSAALALTALSRTDALTGLCNRRAFDEKLAAEWSRCGREGTPLSLILFDLDMFKAYNDELGHQAGDDCLRQVAAAVGAHARRPSDMAARYGGEELAILLPGTDKGGAKSVAENIRQAIARLDIHHPKNQPIGIVTASGGLATSTDVATPSALIEYADKALYEAKRSGRNQIMVYREYDGLRIAKTA